MKDETPVSKMDFIADKIQHIHDDDEQPSDPRIAAAVKRGMEIRDQLDVLVREKYRDDPETLAEWEEASRIWDDSDDDKTG
jgi:hypothetical protein